MGGIENVITDLDSSSGKSVTAAEFLMLGLETEENQ